MKPEEEITFLDPTILKPIGEHTYYDVGSYIIFSNEDYRTLFKNKPFGIFNLEFEYTNKFSIMIRKESIGLANVMRAIHHSQPTDWAALTALPPN